MDQSYKYSFLKLRKFLILPLLLLFFANCNKDDHDIIPNILVDFTIDIGTPRFDDLNSVLNSIVVDESYYGSLSSGYNNNGIVVFRLSLDEFLAFDLTCPHDYDKGIDVAVELENTSDLSAECPECGTKYMLTGYGYPGNTGPSRYPLKQYKTDFYMNLIRVYN